MKGGVGYVQPDSVFSKMADERICAQVRGSSTLTWLDGSSDGEKSIRELVEVGKSTGVVLSM